MVGEEGGAQNMKKPNKKNYAKPKMERWGGGPSLRSCAFHRNPPKTTPRIVEKGRE